MTQLLSKTQHWACACAITATVLAAISGAQAAPTVSRLTPPSALFAINDSNPPFIARFLEGQRFDIQSTVSPDDGQIIKDVQFFVDDRPLFGSVALTPATVPGKPTNTVVATLRAYSNNRSGVHTFSVRARQSNGEVARARGNFEIVRWNGDDDGHKKDDDHDGAKNIIVLIGDGMGIAHRTAARIMLNGVTMGKANGPLSMDVFPVTGMVMTHSLNSIVTDSSPGAACYANGNKATTISTAHFPTTPSRCSTTRA